MWLRLQEAVQAHDPLQVVAVADHVEAALAPKAVADRGGERRVDGRVRFCLGKVL
jgi:hypothetical protein